MSGKSYTNAWNVMEADGAFCHLPGKFYQLWDSRVAMDGVPSAVSISSTIQTSASNAGEPCHEQLPLTSTPCTTSQAVQRKRKRLQRFLDGKANAAYEFNTALHGSFSSFSSDDADSSSQKEWVWVHARLLHSTHQPLQVFRGYQRAACKDTAKAKGKL